ncbi:MAG: tRNA pseudouridine synthase B [Candidatus Nomurabacteria bacterium GW2011_GWB1_37_5]|uniref:tRNA pseudouridine synthase B n=1 Tax=Candidatus Nomurabacteria bacterium GW2011_GWB1_37_5 TaxID=1618742 RepID=A0A0G0H0W2_9BACT|nr:MAG: tRNA pseudouridine synthase B [Candidatus Nomurabacteria bacterium GW2011_GWB1_37_5]
MFSQNILLVDKPAGWSSYDVIRYLKRELKSKFGKTPRVNSRGRTSEHLEDRPLTPGVGENFDLKTDLLKSDLKIGHAGTLDPMATGLLVVLLGDATKKFAEFQKLKKEYEAVIEFGKKTDTYDKEGKIVFDYDKSFEINQEQVEKALNNFVGKINQVPPPHSAVKVSGRRAYDLARAGKKFELAPKQVEVYEAKILRIKDKRLWINFTVSSGTYIRSLAHDLGEMLGYGAYLTELRRTKIGDYDVKDAEKIN